MASAPRRRITYSQDFLHNRQLVDRLLDRSSLSARDCVLEIGPGQGIITERLAQRCRQVIAVEKDAVLAARLRRRLARRPNVAVHAADFLTFPLPPRPYKVFANIPFNITTAIVAKLTSGISPPTDSYLAVQREAAQRFLGQPDQTLYALLLQPWFAVSLFHRFRRTDFIPPPGVGVSMLRIRQRSCPLIPREDAQLYRDLVTYGFTAWQPSLGAMFAKLLGTRRGLALLCQSGIEPISRPSQVTFTNWLALFSAFKALGDRRAIRQIEGAEGRLRRQQARLTKSYRTGLRDRTVVRLGEFVH